MIVSHDKGALPVPGKEEHSHHQRLEVNAQMNLCKQTYSNNPYLLLVSPMYVLVAFSQLTVPSSRPLSSYIPVIYHSFCEKVFFLKPPCTSKNIK